MELLRDSDPQDLDRGKLELADHCMMDGGLYLTVAGALAVVKLLETKRICERLQE
jgi:hypothetical protein